MTFKLSLIASTILVLSLHALETPTMTEEEAIKQVTEQLKAEKAKKAAEAEKAKLEEEALAVQKAADTEKERLAKEAADIKQVDSEVKEEAKQAVKSETAVANKAEDTNEELMSKIDQRLKDINAAHNEDRPYIPKKDINASEFPYIKPIAVEDAPKEHDDDHDGVLNDVDKCPDTPEGVMVDADGCCLDDDHDGVCNYKDKCLETPEGRMVDEDGCQIDEDKDGVLDYDDQCPHTPQMFKVNSVGCPLTAVLKVNFDTNKYNIKDNYLDDVNNFAEFLKQNPGYDAIIYGHTDSIGSYESNDLLSDNRAKSVREALIERGVEANRLTAVGKGERFPIATNMNKEGRAQNRRIEVELKPKVNPTPVAPQGSDAADITDTTDTADMTDSSDMSVDNFN